LAFRQKLDGTTRDVFDIGLNKGILDFSNLTTSRLLKFPDSDGSSGYVLSTDGAGNLSWNAVTASATTPYYIPIGGTWINNLYNQSLFAVSIDVQGILEVDGILCEVD
jgi:hypothetical protein